MGRKTKIAVFVLALLTIGFLREALFVNMNAVLYNKYYQPGEEARLFNPAFSFLTDFSYQTLYVSKWFITPFFAALFWFVQRRFLVFLFPEKKPAFWLTVLYLSLLLLAGISFAAGWAFGFMNEGYRFSRIFMGLLQSPAPCMLIIPLAYFYKKTNT